MPTITIDTTALTSTRFTIPSYTDWLDGANAAERQVTLDPGSYQLTQHMVQGSPSPSSRTGRSVTTPPWRGYSRGRAQAP